MIAEATSSRSRLEQRVAIKRWADGQGRALTRGVLVPRTRARYRPEQDAWLREVIENARSDGRVLVMDDVFRFVEGDGAKDVEQMFAGLTSLEPPIFSIRHGSPLLGLTRATCKHEMERRAQAYVNRSKRAERAAADPANLQPAPTAKARQKAIRVRKLVAEQTAQRLAGEIERVRASLVAGERANLSAIARALNAAEIPPPSGQGRWQGTTVKRVLDRVARLQGD